MHPAPLNPIVACARAASIAAALLASIGGASAAPGAEAPERCLFAAHVNGFSDVSDDETSVILEAGASQRYRVHLFERCYGLDDALQIAVSARMTCVQKGDRIVYSFGGFRRDCAITALEPVNNDNTPAPGAGRAEASP